MDIFTVEFGFAFIFLTSIYYFLPLKWQNRSLVLANVIFLFSCGLASFLTCFFSSIFQYFVYKKILKTEGHVEFKSRLVTVAICLQVGLLFLFKVLNVSSDFGDSGSRLPIGISYYSLMLIAFLLEVYWKRNRMELSFLDYFTITSFFPVIMMGPIERLSRFWLQISSRRVFELNNFKLGFYSIALGVFKITAISNALSATISHKNLNAFDVHGWGLYVYCVMAFVKLYAEFSGFIDVVTGLSHFLGFQLSPNFDQPYLSRNVADVWRRWHISLTIWLRDFLFMPILLKTKSTTIAAVAVLIAVGMWHGLSLAYAYWTTYWILAFAFYMQFSKLKFAKVLIHSAIKICFTFTIISLSSLCFIIPYTGFLNLMSRITRLHFNSIFSFASYSPLSRLDLFVLVAAIGLMIFFESFYRRSKLFGVELKTMMLFFLIALMGKFNSVDFLYLHF